MIPGRLPLWVGALVIVVACIVGSQRFLAPLPSSSSIPDGLYFSGCGRVLEGHLCLLTRGATLTWFVEGRISDGLTVELAGDEVPTSTRRFDDGIRVQATANRDGPLVLQADGEDLGVLMLEVTDSEPSSDGMEEAREAMAEADWSRAAELLRAAHDRAEAQGDWTATLETRLVLAYVLSVGMAAFDDALEQLNGAKAYESRLPDVLAFVPHYEGVVWLERGEIAEASVRFRQAARWAERLDMPRLWALGAQERARMELSFGRFGSALALLSQARTSLRRHGKRCDGALLDLYLAWAQLQAREAGGLEAAPDPTPRLRRVLSATDCVYHGQSQNAARLNLAIAAVQEEQAEKALRHLEQLDESKVTLQLDLWRHEIQARVALLQKDSAGAVREASILFRKAEIAGQPSVAFRAMLTLARAHRYRGDLADALQAYASAERSLDEVSLDLPLLDGLHEFLAQRQHAVLEYVDLLATHDPRSALEVLRNARTRSLGWARVTRDVARLSPQERRTWDRVLASYRQERRALDTEAESDWELSASELEKVREQRIARADRLRGLLDQALTMLPARPTRDRQTRDGDVRLAYAILGQQILAIANGNSKTVAVRFDPADRSIPRSLADLMGDAQRVVLLPFGPARVADLHGFDYRGEPLALQLPVVYALDLEDGEDTFPPLQDALLLSDVQGSLPEAEIEVELMKEELTRSQLSVVALSDESVPLAELREAIEGADWFHYAGHGEWQELDFLAAGIPLDSQTLFSIGDVLALRQAPSLVTLSSCEAGRNRIDGGESLGLAQAFLVAGSEAVVAPTRKVDDLSARRFAAAFVRAAGTPEARYRSAVAVLEGSGDDSWAAYRLFVP